VELVTEARAPITAQQQWARALARAGVTARVRSGGSAAKIGVEVRGSETAPIYLVTGVVTSSNQLLTPGGRFRLHEVDKLARWLDDLAKYGPADQRPELAAFGLSADEFSELRKELSRRVGFSTDGASRAEVVRKIAARLTLPVRVDGDLSRSLEHESVSADLDGLSCGTALAYAIRAPGLALMPRQAAGNGLELAVVRAGRDTEAWPVGWEPEEPEPKVLPKIYEVLNVNVQGVTALEVLDAVRQRLEVPVLLDHNAMARHGVEPDKLVVNMPQRRTTYVRLLRTTLFQAGLKHELRVDEAGKPFLWITTLKPI
jgi:hypothetical protein